MPLTITDFLSRRQRQAVIDVRSEGEYEAGHIRGACNIPLLNNEERVVVGTTYKQKGLDRPLKKAFAWLDQGCWKLFSKQRKSRKITRSWCTVGVEECDQTISVSS